jgi:hypothetical protein
MYKGVRILMIAECNGVAQVWRLYTGDIVGFEITERIKNTDIVYNEKEAVDEPVCARGM